MGQDPAGEGLQRIHREGILTAIDYNVDTEEYTYTVDGKEYTTTQDSSALFAMNVTVLAKDDEALLVRINKGGVVVSANIGDISDMGDKNDHFNTIEVNGETYRLDNTAKDWDTFWSIACGYNQYGEQGFWGFPGAAPDTPSTISMPLPASTRMAAATSMWSLSIPMRS